MTEMLESNFPLSVLLLAGLVCFVIGLGIGGLIMSLQKGNKEQDSLPPGVKKGRFLPVFRLWYEEEKKILLLEWNGVSYPDPRKLTQEQRMALAKQAQSLIGWLGFSNKPAKPAANPAPVEPQARPTPEVNPQPSAPQPPAVPPAAAPIAAAAAATVTTATVTTAASVPTGTKPAAPEIPPVQPLPVREAPVQRPISPVPPPPPPPPADEKKKPLTIVEQIDAVLQEKLEGTGLEKRGIRLTGDHRGVVVWVGNEHFEGIDLVPYPEVQDVIRKSVAEWERTTS